MKVRYQIFIPGSSLVIAILLVLFFFIFQKSEEQLSSTPAAPPDSAVHKDSIETYMPTSYSYKIVNIYPHDQGAFTQGLAFEDGFLYEGTGGTGISMLRKVELETGKILKERRLRGHYFGEGVTIYKDKVIQITYLSKTGFVYTKESFEVLHRFSYSSEGWGLTYDGTRLIMSDGTATLYFLDPETFENIGQMEVYDHNGPVPFLNELEYIKGHIYANVWQTDDIAIVSPQTGRVAGYIHLQGLLDPSYQEPVDVLNGIAYDSQNDRLFVTGKLWPELFEIELIPVK